MTPLDEATRERLRWEAERLAAEQEIDLQAARRIVWDDYLDEQAAYATPVATAGPEPPQPEPSPLETPVPEPPAVTKPIAGRIKDSHAEQVPSRQRFWRAADEVAMTPEQLQKNRAELAKVKRLVGLRS